MSINSPIVILGSHRAGTSAVAGLLSLSGLELGDVIPPTPDNPKGYFESASILGANRRLLALMGRDWTCPPSVVARDLDLAFLEDAIAELEVSDQLWGFKDPRTLFLLPAWAKVIPRFRFVGVYRETSEVAASLTRRDGFTPETAWSIALRYNERLQRVHEELRFPLVRYGSGRDVLLDRIAEIAGHLDLELDRADAEAFLDEAREQALTDASTEADEYLAMQAEHPVESLVVYEAERVVGLERRSSYTRIWDSPSHVGPSQVRRVRGLWAQAMTTSRAVGTVVLVTPADSPTAEALAGADPARTILACVSSLWNVDGAVAASHIVAAGVLDHIEPDALPEFLQQLDRITTSDAVVALDGFIVDTVRLPPDLYMNRVDVTASRVERPYLHHLDEIEAAVLGTSWLVGRVALDDHDETRLDVVLVKDPAKRVTGLVSSSELREKMARMTSQSIEISRARDLSTSDPEQALLALDQAMTSGLAALAGEITAVSSKLDVERATVRELRSQLADFEAALAERKAAIGDRDAEIEELLAARDAAEDSARSVLGEVGTLKDEVAAAEKKVTAITMRYNRLLNRRIVRLALSVAGAFRPLFRWRRGQRKTNSVTHTAESAAVSNSYPKRRTTRREVEREILRLRPQEGPTSGPLVSMVVLTRDGAHHLKRLFAGLRERTAYRSFEVVVVDNASKDETPVVLGGDWGFPIQVIRNEHNASFSEGCNQGIEAAQGDYVLLLNNDVDPINPGWLGALVEELESVRSVDAAGALLVYPEAPESANQSVSDHALTVQHRGIAFRWRSGAPVGYNMGYGEDPTDGALVNTVSVPGVTAACMLLRATTLRSLGGLDERFVYGSEDVDLSLRIRELGGDVVLVGRSALFHHEFGTQSTQGNHRQRAYRGANFQYFAEKWAPRLSRTLHLAAISAGVLSWSGIEARKVAITLTKDDPSGGWGDWHTAHELGEAFSASGWEVVYAEAFQERWRDIPTDVNLVISLLDRYDVTLAPEGAVTVAWIRNWTDRWIERPWIGSYDALIPSSRLSAELLESAGLNVAGILPLATNPERFHPMEADAVYESDYVFTGNHWGENRLLLSHLDVAPGERFSVFGKGWESVGRMSRYWRGPAPYDDLPLVYNSAKVVLDDTAGPTLPYGAINSRVFDALACGTLVLTDNARGSEEFFDGILPAFSSRSELRELLDRYLTDSELRETTAAELQRIVLAQHTYAARVPQFLDLVRQRMMAPRVALKIGPPNYAEAERWGDTHFARAFAGALERRGWRTSIDILPEWDSPNAQSADVVVHLRGLVPYVPKPGQVNVLWIISHPEDVSDAECERYDLVLVASAPHAEVLRKRLDVPVATMLQATEFHVSGALDGEVSALSSEDEGSSPDVLFVGNSRGVRRPAIEWATDRGIPVVVYGSGWDGLIDESLVAGKYVPNEELAGMYRSAGVVLNDHWPEMRDRGFISNRVFDVMASGGFIISDEIAGIEDVFGGIVPTFSDADELERLVTYYRENPDERALLVERGRAIVASEHGFDQRAHQFLSLTSPLLFDRLLTIERAALPQP